MRVTISPLAERDLESIGDYIAEDNPVRVVDAFVDELDLKRLGFAGADPAATGEVGQGTMDRHQCAGKHGVLVRSEWKFNVATDAQDHVGAVDGARHPHASDCPPQATRVLSSLVRPMNW